VPGQKHGKREDGGNDKGKTDVPKRASWRKHEPHLKAIQAIQRLGT
jgi:hypothetical protein